MKTTTILYLLVLLISCFDSMSQSRASKKTTGRVEIVIKPTVGSQSLYLDSVYENPSGEKYILKKFKFFVSDIALAKAVGEEVSVTTENPNGIYLIDFRESNFDAGSGKQSCKIEFKAPPGNYSDIRFTVGIPRKVNHLDPTNVAPPLDLAKSDMYWTWNSGYIFLLAEGHRPDTENEFFHFAIGGDSRLMPMYFGNLFNVKPLIEVSENKKTIITFSLDFNKLFLNGNNTKYSMQQEEAAIVHGGHYADALRNNFINAFELPSVKTVEAPIKIK